jgi:hypothetical protein
MLSDQFGRRGVDAHGVSDRSFARVGGDDLIEMGCRRRK